MAVTRSKSTSLQPPFDETIVLKQIKTTESTNSKVVKPYSTSRTPKAPKTPKSPRKSAAKVNLEDLLSHVEIPRGYQLPEEFINYHKSEFIEGINYIISKDPTLYPVIVHKNFTSFKKEGELKESQSELEIILQYWYSLISSVISQQISGSAARSIEAKFKNLFNGNKPTPKETIRKTTDELRGAGLSNQKIKYVIHISEVFNDPNSKLSKLEFYKSNPLDKIIEELVSLKGIGVWSAKMFALFTLNEMDVFAYDDLGIARGMSRYLLKRQEVLNNVKMEISKIEEIKILLKKKSKFENSRNSKRDWIPIHDEYVKYVASRFSPYQSVFSLILWRLGSTNVEVLEATGIAK